MRIVIVGYGRVGARTARVLCEEGHEVFVIDVDPRKVSRAREAGFEAVEGDASREDVIEQADLDSADAVGALTPDLNVNFAVCMVGKHHGCRTVMRIDEDYRQDVYQEYAEDVDEVVYPERLGAAAAKTALLGGDFSVVADLAERLQLSTVHVPEGSPVVGKRVSAVDLPAGARIYAHGRTRGALTIPLPGTRLEAGDRVAVVAELEVAEDVRDVLRGEAPVEDGAD